MLICLLSASPVARCQIYVVTDLGFPNDSYSETHGINASGAVVGEYELTNSSAVSAFLYQNGIRIDLGFLGGPPYAAAFSINASNHVVGESSFAINTHGFEWANGTMADLGALGGSSYSSAHAINQGGQIVGESSTSFLFNSPIHAVLWSGGAVQDLGALAGNYSSAYGINSVGVIVGETDVLPTGWSNTVTHAFVYSNNSMQDLGTLPGTNDYSAGFGINDSGVIVGESDTVVGGVATTHAFIYRSGTMSDLGTFGGSLSSASAINTAGQVVGYANDANETSCAFLYNGSGVINLNSFITPGSGFTNLASADAINDAGQIAGSGFLADGSYHAYLLTPAGPLVVAITNPAAHAILFAPATFALCAYVSDRAGTVTNVQFLVNSNVTANATSAPYSCLVSNLTMGTYTLCAVASDDTGLKATNRIAVTVADSPPKIAITNPLPNAVFLPSVTIAVSAAASDIDGTVTNVQFQVNGATIGNATTTPYSATATNLAAGAYTVTAIAWDNGGLIASNSIQVFVSTDAPPTVAITSPAPGSSFPAPASFAVDASASDSDGAVTNVQFLVNGNVVSNVTTAPYGAAIGNLAAGTYTLTAVAADNAGLSKADSVRVVVVAPITLLNPATSGAGFSFALTTQAGLTYDGQVTTAPATSNSWLTFASVPGNGSLVRLTNAPLTSAQSFYRVIAH